MASSQLQAGHLFSMHDACTLIRSGGMRPDLDWLYGSTALSCGRVAYLRTLRIPHQYG
jgi:hypothetical protein